MKCITTLIALLLVSCGGAGFQAGEPSAPTADAAPSSDPASSDSSPSPEATPVSSESGPSPESSSPETVPDATAAADGSITRADASDAGEQCPDAGCVCIVVTPGYGCPAGYPYVQRDAGVESCCNAP